MINYKAEATGLQCYSLKYNTKGKKEKYKQKRDVEIMKKDVASKW